MGAIGEATHRRPGLGFGAITFYEPEATLESLPSIMNRTPVDASSLAVIVPEAGRRQPRSCSDAYPCVALKVPTWEVRCAHFYRRRAEAEEGVRMLPLKRGRRRAPAI